MFKFVPFHREHIRPLLEQQTNLPLRSFYNEATLASLENKYSVTGMIEGIPVFCGGIIELWAGRGYCWIVFNESSKFNFVPVFRGIRTFLDIQPFNRIEVAVPFHSYKYRRRVELLGFTLDCERARKFLPDGSDCSLYSKVRS